MSAYQNVSPDGTTVTLGLNGNPAITYTSSGAQFTKNKLINGEVTRINQRGVANWAAVSNGNYGYDRWKKVDASNITQIIEAGNFRPSTVHTLSGVGVTTQQITSPASGNWTLPNIPIAAIDVQVEEGNVATPFENRPIQFELAMCQRYYETLQGVEGSQINTSGQVGRLYYKFNVPKRAAPNVTLGSSSNGTAVGITTDGFVISVSSGTAGPYAGVGGNIEKEL